MKKMRAVVAIAVAAMMFVTGGCQMERENQSMDDTESAVSLEASNEAVSDEARSDAEESSALEEPSESEESSESEEPSETEEPSEPEESSAVDNSPFITLDKTEYSTADKITVTYGNTDSKDWVGLYGGTDEPGTVNSIVWKYSEGEGTLTFNASNLGGAGEYTAFLCDNDGYDVLDAVKFTVRSNDTVDYGATAAEVDASVTDGVRRISVSVTPSDGGAHTYLFYWSANGSRLDGFEPIYETVHSGASAFTVKFNDYLYMPDDADGIEVYVKEGKSTSLFVSAPATLKLEKSVLRYKFNVLTDLHIISTSASAQSHLKLALKEIHSLTPDSIAVFTCGDNTDRGQEADYELLFDIISKNGVDLPEMHFALGNHDIVYGGTYEQQIELFKKYTGDEAPYYSVEISGTKFIVLGSDTLNANGTVGSKQLEWLKDELAKAESGKPIFLFLHQPLIETVSGSLYSLDNEIQDWYGIYATGSELREILSDYPNAFLFTGHTHWQFSSIQPILAGGGSDANFVNCASVGYLWTDDDVATGGSQGMFVEVYEDYILLRGREFVNGTWCASAQFAIPLYD